ncbi:methyltransferase [Paracoccus sp. Z118]|uniref:class I SAM-dependent methyltransferase n=1 Tax=Paracoccus sp. Z118 TaxID=2851017 RepID=UPI001C2BBC5F|nr:methyltransferase [Paracoccus sp. Z118]MBV0891000.1 methyltransferase [Paracoccus sp. Z118]
MAGSRLELIAPEGPVLLVGARASDDLSGFDPASAVVVQGLRPDHDSLKARGFRVLPLLSDLAEGDAANSAVVFLPRARALARARIAAAAAVLPPGAALWIDGQKTDGIDAALKEMRGLADVDEVHSRAHGKIFRVTVPSGDWLPEDWVARDIDLGGFVTRPGLFSADGVDPASAMLAAHLPERMPTRVVDLGAGWGWLSAQVLARPGVEALHLVEADAEALACARRNITDPRAAFHWADATTFRLPEPVNGVVMNPPFHDGRAADPHLGARFIRAAAGLLTGAGRLWMVANRHLPYEAALNEHFAGVTEIGGDTRFKIISASGARRTAAPATRTRRR